VRRAKEPGATAHRGVARLRSRRARGEGAADDRIAIRTADELYANIPVYAANFESKLAHAGMLNVGMTIVGRYDAGLMRIDGAALAGDCEGATHVVTAITVGAFEFYAGAEAEAGAGFELASAGVGAKSTATRETLNRDGDARKCDDASPGDGAPPFGCGAIIRIEVVPLGDWSAGAAKAPPGAPKAAPAPKAVPAPETAELVAEPTPKRPARAPTKAPAQHPAVSSSSSCKFGDEPTCSSQCSGGDAPSCATLSRMIRDAKDYPRAFELAKSSCAKGAMLGCVIQAEMLFQGQHVKRDSAAARPLLERACRAGEPMGCNDLGLYHQQVRRGARQSAIPASVLGGHLASVQTSQIACPRARTMD